MAAFRLAPAIGNPHDGTERGVRVVRHEANKKQ